MLKIAICDDSPLFLEQAVIMIREWSTERHLPIELCIPVRTETG